MPKPLTPEQAKLAADNLPLAFFVVGQLWHRADVKALGLDDARSAAMHGITKAAAGFDPARGYRFSSYAFRAGANAVIKEARDWQKRAGKQLTEDTDQATDPALVASLVPARPEPDHDLHLDVLDLVARACLSPRQRLMIDCMLEGLDEAQTRKRLGLSRARINRLKWEAVGRIRAFGLRAGLTMAKG